MSSKQKRPAISGYTFGRELPVDEVDEGKSILIRGPSKSERRDFVLDLLKSRNGEVVDPAVVITTDELGSKVVERYNTRVGQSAARIPLGVVDCMPNPTPYSVQEASIARVGGPGDLTGVGVEATNMIDSMNQRGFGRVRVVLDSICPMTMYTDIEVLFRFLHMMVGAIQSTESIGIFTMDPESHDERTLSMVEHLFDYVLDVGDYRGFGVTGSEGFD